MFLGRRLSEGDVGHVPAEARQAKVEKNPDLRSFRVPCFCENDKKTSCFHINALPPSDWRERAERFSAEAGMCASGRGVMCVFFQRMRGCG